METAYIQEISQGSINYIKKAILKYRKGYFIKDINFPKAIAAILEMEIEHPEYQEFALDNLSQIVGIISRKNPSYLAIKSTLRGEFYFQVDNEEEKPY